MKGLYSVRPVADHEVIPYMLHFTARHKKQVKGEETEVWIVGSPTHWFTKTQLNWEYKPNSFTAIALIIVGLVLTAAVAAMGIVNGFTLGQWGTAIVAGLIAIVLLLLLPVAVARQKRLIARPRRFTDRDSVRVVLPEIARTNAWYELVRAVDRFVVTIRAPDHDYDQLSAKIYRELKRALWEAASVDRESAPVYAQRILPVRAREASTLVDAYSASLEPLPVAAAA